MAKGKKTAQKMAISIKNLSKTYEGAKDKALKNINLNIPEGSIYGLLGPNGAGKSTLINILAGLTIKDKGAVTINGDDLDKDARKTRFSIGVVPQEVIIDPFFSVRETLEYYAGYYGIPKSKRRTDEILKALSLEDKKSVNSRRLSGGMKRRVLIAKALVHSPPILILDEPTAGVDVELRTQLWSYVRELNKNGTTILLTTHYLEEAEELCDNIAIINHGKIIADDKTKSLKKIIDKKQLTLIFAENIKEIPKKLKKFDAKIIDKNTLSITYSPQKISPDVLIGFTKAENLTIKDLSTQEPDLEDIFRHLVGSK